MKLDYHLLIRLVSVPLWIENKSIERPYQKKKLNHFILIQLYTTFHPVSLVFIVSYNKNCFGCK